MSGLEDLYKEIILDHYRNPRNRGELDVPPAHVAEGFNPLCGDEIVVYLTVEDDRIAQLRIAGQGCSISQSSASMMAEALEGRTVAEVQSLARTFRSMMSIHEAALDDADSPENDLLDTTRVDDELGDLVALRGVLKFPVRIKCATLGWNTMLDALAQAGA